MKKRFANMELLRIVTMFLIVSLHYVSYTDILSSGNVYIARMIYAFTYCCVDIFVLISGWFFSKSNVIGFKKATEKSVFLWLKTIFYSIVMFVIAVVVLKQKIYPDLLIETFLPVTCSAYWFLTAFICLLFAVPFLDKLINSISTNQHKLIVLAIIMMFCVPATFFPDNWLMDKSEGFSLIWFLCLYLIGAYLHRITDNIKQSKYLFLIGYFVCCLLIFAYFVIVKKLCLKLGITDRSVRVYRYTSLPVLASAICLLLFFAKIDIKSPKAEKIILSFSSVTFDVYLIHCYELMCSHLYVDILHADKYYNSPFLLLHFIGSALLIYVAATVIGLIRSKLLDKPFRFIAEKSGEFVDRIEHRISSKQY